MAQQSLKSVETNENGLFSSSELLAEDMRIGLIYPSEEVAVEVGREGSLSLVESETNKDISRVRRKNKRSSLPRLSS